MLSLPARRWPIWSSATGTSRSRNEDGRCRVVRGNVGDRPAQWWADRVGVKERLGTIGQTRGPASGDGGRRVDSVSRAREYAGSFCYSKLTVKPRISGLGGL